MGRAEAALLAGAGARVAIVDRDGPGAEQACAEITAAGGQAVGIQADLTSSEDIARIAQTVEAEFGAVHVLVNNAGAFDYYKPSLDTSRELWDRQLSINLTSMFEMTNAVLPGMIEQRSGAIINISSIAGMLAGKGGAAYTVAKHGVIGYTRHIASAYGPDGIRCNAILPGTIETAITRDILADIPTDPIPLNRFGHTGDVAAFVLTLAAQRDGFMNGACLTVDGGFSIQ